MDWDFSLVHMTMDVSSVLAALSSRGAPSVTGTNIQVATPQGCTPGLANPEPSGAFIHPGQYLHGSRGYLMVVPAGPTPPLGPQCTQMDAVGTPEVTFLLSLCTVQPKRLKDSPATVPIVP